MGEFLFNRFYCRILNVQSFAHGYIIKEDVSRKQWFLPSVAFINAFIELRSKKPIEKITVKELAEYAKK